MREKSSRARKPSEETFEPTIDRSLHCGTGGFPFPGNKNQALRGPVDILRAQCEEVGGAGTCRPEKIQEVPEFLAPRAAAEEPVGGCGDREVILHAGPFGFCRNSTDSPEPPLQGRGGVLPSLCLPSNELWFSLPKRITFRTTCFKIALFGVTPKIHPVFIRACGRLRDMAEGVGLPPAFHKLLIIRCR